MKKINIPDNDISGKEIMFLSEDSKTGLSIGEARQCDKCLKITYINGMGIEKASSIVKLEHPYRLKNLYFYKYLQEYEPELTEDGGTICQFCNKEEK